MGSRDGERDGEMERDGEKEIDGETQIEDKEEKLGDKGGEYRADRERGDRETERGEIEKHRESDKEKLHRNYTEK